MGLFVFGFFFVCDRISERFPFPLKWDEFVKINLMLELSRNIMTLDFTSYFRGMTE